jgi:Secretion system C-terminal sorting domain
LRTAPDGKIYMSNAWYNGFQFNYPYQDTVYNYVNMNLSVVNNPDSLGLASNFQAYSFYLGGKRTYWGLPNNPDYDLGPLQGSICDTLVSINELTSSSASMSLYFNKGLENVYVNAKNLKGNIYQLQVYDMFGHIIYTENGRFSPTYFTKELHITGLAHGMYVLRFETNKELLVEKMMVR